MRRRLPDVFVSFAMRLFPLVLLGQDATLRGVVTDSTGAVLTNSTVILLDRGAVRVATTATRNDGSFAFRTVAPGE